MSVTHRLVIRYHVPGDSGEPQTDEAHVVIDRYNVTAVLERAAQAGYIAATHWHHGGRLYIPWHRIIDVMERHP